MQRQSKAVGFWIVKVYQGFSLSPFLLLFHSYARILRRYQTFRYVAICSTRKRSVNEQLPCCVF